MTILSVQISKGVHSKKLILDTCTKTAFSFNNNIICKQKDGVSMGSSLGPIIPSRPNSRRSEKIKFLFSHFFVVPQKVL